ncbi:MAG: MarR family transcriptional regulator [Synechococcaceae cyanobacterium SM2_3_2]|nr:MarR family transcriptional regulator [Synechococcaceae cyanobacterium SM2_3_2]
MSNSTTTSRHNGTSSHTEALVPPTPQLREPFLEVLRELAGGYQAFTVYSDTHVRKMGLTPPQFDVIATLGNTAGMTMNVLAEKTLVTKGTLTGIVDRLQDKGLVRREVPPENRRCFLIVLTPEGEQVFRETFPAQIAHLKERFDQLDPEDLVTLKTSLRKLRLLFQQG